MNLLNKFIDFSKGIFFTKPRVLLRVHSVRRDGGYNIILKKILEELGFEVFIACTRNLNFCLRYWRPDIVIISTLRLIKHIKNLSPNAYVVFLEGEGFQVKNDDRANFCFQNKQYFDLYDLFLIWGDGQLEGFQKFKNFMNIEKVFAIGNPKVDVVKFLPIQSIDNKRKSLGFLCRFTSINHHEGIPVIRNLEKKKQLDYAKMLLDSYHTIHKTILFFLKNTKYNISIRPHPTEALETYYKFVVPSFGERYKNRIQIDENLFVSDWMIRQKIIFCPTSTSFIESYIMKVPIVNLDKLSGSYTYSKNYSRATREWLNASINPKSYKELEKIVRSTRKMKSCKKIEKQLNLVCNLEKGESSLLNASNLIIKKFKRNKKIKLGIPSILLSVCDELLFKRMMKKNPLHLNFSYKSNIHKDPIYLNEFVSNIFNRKPNIF